MDDDMSQFDRDCIDQENREWTMQQKDKEIERLKEKLKLVEGVRDEVKESNLRLNKTFNKLQQVLKEGE